MYKQPHWEIHDGLVQYIQQKLFEEKNSKLGNFGVANEKQI